MDKVIIKNLLCRGILGINPDERIKKQDILVNIVLTTDVRKAAASDNIEDAVNYKSITKRILQHVEEDQQDLLVEKLVTDIARICLFEFEGVKTAAVRVEKPSALRFADSVGIEITRSKADF
ncbi:MAG: dihydroneopterin aldolase [Chloroflexota bacterium]